MRGFSLLSVSLVVLVSLLVLLLVLEQAVLHVRSWTDFRSRVADSQQTFAVSVSLLHARDVNAPGNGLAWWDPERKRVMRGVVDPVLWDSLESDATLFPEGLNALELRFPDGAVRRIESGFAESSDCRVVNRLVWVAELPRWRKALLRMEFCGGNRA
ncbi:MAG: hypothetical protein HY917_01115 [Candidatus Diapherotrites archaeon]|nr:hypothetical protein [Candidatus Diapherotrites archaeon]